MQKTMKKALSILLALVMVLGMLPATASATESQQLSNAALPTSMDGLSIAYPYNTENVTLTDTPVSRFQALTFESARNEVESAQMILTPDFKVDSFELTMPDMYNEKGNVIPSWAFEVYIQHYHNVTGAGNSAHYDKFETLDSWLLNKQYSEELYHPRSGNSAPNGAYPDALIPQDAAINAGENSIAAGNNKGIWVNLNIQGAAPGTYTGAAILTVNGTAMQIPVSIRVYDVAIPDEVHNILSMGIWWDQLQAGEGYVTQDLADSYYNYLVSKRISPWDRWNYWYTTEGLVTNVVSMASNPKIPAYLLYYTPNGREVDRASVVTTLTGVINKNIELAQAGNAVDLFAKAYFYFACVDEPAGSSSAPTYAEVQNAINVLDSVKAELAPMLDAYPSLKQSFLGIKNIVTGPNPSDETLLINGCPDYSEHSPLTSTYGSVLYCPQYQYLQTAEQRALYANDSEVWWYGCCHPVAPYPTFQYNNPLINSRALGFMMYEYGIDGAVYSSANYWGKYVDNGISLYDYWNGYSNGTPGDQILVYPGSDYGVFGPIGSMRIENIRESSEDYEYLWLLNQFGGNIATYTAGLYEGAIVTGVYDGHAVDPDGDGNTDANTLYHTRRVALLAKLEEMNVSANGATNIAPGQEGFVRGKTFTSGKDTYFYLEEAGAWKYVSFDYKTNGIGELAAILRGSTWTTYYGDFRLTDQGEKQDYPGVTTTKLGDGYVRVTFDIEALQRTGCIDNLNLAPADIALIDIFGAWTTVGGYLDNIVYSMEAPEPPVQEEVFRGQPFTAGKDTYFYLEEAGEWDLLSFDYKPTEAGEMAVVIRGSQWTKYFGDFRMNGDGEKVDYAGVTAEKLEDGYVRVTFDLTELQRSACVDNRDNAPTDVMLIDIFGAWTTTNGYIDNIRVSNKEPEEVIRGQAFTAGKDNYFTFEAGEWDLLSFDYKPTGEGEIAAIIRGSAWTKFYGDFRLTAAGEKVDYDGITTEILEDGYIRVTFDIEKLGRTNCANDRSNAPVDVALIDIYNWTTTDGYIDNIQPSNKEVVIRGQAFTAAKDNFFYLDEAGAWDTLSFDYRTEGAGEVAVIMRGSQWSTFYGDFRLTETGEKVDYDGITTEVLEDGYIRATFDIPALQRSGCVNNRDAAPVDIKLIDIYNWTTVNGYIDNIQYSAHSHSYETVVTEPTCENGGYTTYTCGCGHTYTANETAALGHDHKGVVTNPDCLNGGYTTYTCARCGDSYVGTQVDALGHNYESVVTAPTPEAQGFTTHTCSRCGDSYVDSYTDYVPENPYMVLEGDMEVNLSLDKDLYVNLNGFDLTGTITTNGFKVYGIDSTTDGYTCEEIGYFNCVDAEGQTIVPELHHKSEMTGAIKRYLTIETQEGYSFHRIYTGITHKSLRPGVTGVGYKAIFGGDEMVHSQLDAASGFGYSLWLNKDNVVSRGTNASAFVPGSDGNVLTLVLKNFEVTNYGEAPVYATVWLKLADGTVIESAEYSYTMRSLIEQINDNYTLFSETQLTAVRDLIEREPTMQTWNVGNLWQAPRGQAFTAGKDNFFYLDEAGAWDTLSFDYKPTGNGEIAVILRGSSWTKFHGDFRLTAEGEKVDYAGITTEKLEDGYIRVTFTLSELQRSGCVNDRNAAPDDLALIDIYNWTTTDGYIDNIQVTKEEVIRGQSFSAGKDTYFYLEKAGLWDTLSFDYKPTGDGELAVILRGSKWTKYHGDFRLTAEGEKVDYAGITTEKLADGYIHVTFDLSELQRSGCVNNRSYAPDDLALIDIFNWTTTDGYIDNIQVSIQEPTEPVVRGKTFTAGKDTYFSLPQAGNWSTLSFDYRADGEGELAVILRGSKWSTYYGDYRLTNMGEKVDYDGVSVQRLEDGYIRVTFDIAALQRSGCVDNRNNAPVDISLIDMFNWTTVGGYIDNIQYS